MDVWKYHWESRPSVDALKTIADYMLGKLEDYLGLKLKYFNLYIVPGESLVGKFFCCEPSPPLLKSPFQLQVEGVMLYQVADSNPRINAEILLFSNGYRLGRQKDKGKSYLVLRYVQDNNAYWENVGWIVDGDDNWERIVTTRENLYDKFEIVVDE